MPVLFRDYETRSTLNLAHVGAWRYASDAATEVLCIAYAVDDEQVTIWISGEPVPEAFITAANDPDWLVAAHNDQFESAIEERLLGPRYGWPTAPLGRHRCTLAAALAGALPGSLEGAATALGLEARKDVDGRRLMMLMSKPRKPRKGEDPNSIYWHDDPERRLRLQDYCKRDVEIERELYRRLPPLSDAEQALWVLDQKINARGFYVDLELAEAAKKIVAAEQTALDAEISAITGGAVTSINQVARLTTLLAERGHAVSGLTKRSVGALLARKPADDVQRILELRQEGGRAAARKLPSFIDGTDADRRARGCFKFGGAATGRWSGSRIQPQNLVKTTSKEDAIAAVRSGELDRVRKFGAPLAIVGDCSRSMICAAPGHVLMGADFSTIESRVQAWLANETWKLDIYRQFDLTGEPNLEPYCVTASHLLGRTVTPDDETGRQIGKVADLALGFGGGLGAWRRFATSDARTDDEIKANITAWRNAHPAIVRFWRELENSAHRTIRTGPETVCGKIGFVMRDGTLLMRLPSGRSLSYPQARLAPGKFPNSVEIIVKDNARGGWVDDALWFGDLVENAVQAVARDILAAAMVRLEAAGYPIVMHVHDECVSEVREGFGIVDEFLKIMTTPPDWAAGLPIAAKAWCRSGYAKPSTTSPPPPVARNFSISPVKRTNGHLLAPEAIDLGSPANMTIAVPSTEGHSDWVSLVDLIDEQLVDGKIVCPFHADTRPSCHVYDDHVHCFSCGAHVDAVDYLMGTRGINREQALRLLTDPDKPKRELTKTDDGATLAQALSIWDASVPIAGTRVIKYLADVRGIDTDALPTNNAVLRFHPKCPFGIELLPCLVARFSDVVSDEFAGIHRINLTSDVMAGAKATKLTLGRWPRPRVIKLWPASQRLFLGEGIVTVLSAATRIPYDDGEMMRPAWAAGPGGNMANIPTVPGVRELVLLVDHDLKGNGQKYAAECAQRWTGRNVVQMMPERPGADFNNVVLGT